MCVALGMHDVWQEARPHSSSTKIVLKRHWRRFGMVLRPCVVMQIGHNADSPLSIVFAQRLVMDLVMSNVSRGVIE